MKNLDDFIQHYGVKGMHWGVHRNRNRPGGADGVKESKKVEKDGDMVAPKKGKLSKHLDSLKRERQWKKVMSEMDKLTTKDIKDATKRIELENDLKKLSRTKGVGNGKDKSDYLRRGTMSDEELNRKVVRLRAKNSLHKAVSNASKEQREVGEKIVNIGKSLSTKFILKKMTGKPIGAKDIFDVVKKPKDSANNAKEELQKELLNKISSKSKS